MRKKYLSAIEFSDFSAYNNVLSKIPAEYNLQFANSSAIRYAQLFDIDPSQNVYCNRGTT
jgi:2-succinyl-5-enolpyruvyl-6-hydroxy-3-cyclohexene-1-carboxylate synthase